jgi:NAD(P)-dependent dehydrogenase (short-subunit alcohol dehydrogenase family)
MVTGASGGAQLRPSASKALEIEAGAKSISVEQVLSQGQQRVPLGRYASPEEIARVALFLAPDQASYVTGAVIPMDGVANPVT